MRDGITFVLNGERIDLDGVDPTTTLLRFLRERQRLSGSKEGCGEGDCGACTVLMASLPADAAGVRYRAINACITLLASLHGTLIVTVEDVAGPGDALHPCQQAMVDAHGSQCGFCTPGFVVSLYHLFLQRHGTASAAGVPVAIPAREEINDWLAGNLCRCTGYGPIATAARRMFELPRPHWDSERRAGDLSWLQAIAPTATAMLDGEGRRAFIPVSLDALCELAAAHPDARIVAGATDVALWVTKQARPLPLTIHTSALVDPAFRTAREAGGRLYLGAGLAHGDHGQTAAPLSELWRRFAGRQVRAVGTVGGNIANASPIGDLAPAFLVLDAVVHLRHGRDLRRLALADFFLGYGKTALQPGEVLVGIDLDARDGFDGLSVHKVSKRFDDDISAVCGAFNIAVSDGIVSGARVAFGGMAATPKRAAAVEAALIGMPWTRATIDNARAAFAIDFQPISDMRASAGYRLDVAHALLVRTFIERASPEVATRVLGGVGVREL